MGHGRGKSASIALPEIEDVLAGMILLWSGTIGSIPIGFVLCDGNNGTPDLTDKFVLGAGDSYNPGNQAGSQNHTHGFTGDGHSHTLGAVDGIAAGTDIGRFISTNLSTGTTDISDVLPPYYALAYIMKT